MPSWMLCRATAGLTTPGHLELHAGICLAQDSGGLAGRSGPNAATGGFTIGPCQILNIFKKEQSVDKMTGNSQHSPFQGHR